MSATRDKSQKITFVYSNLYSIYRKGIERAREGAIRESGESSPSRAAEALTELATSRSPAAYESGVVIKARDARATPPYTPAELIGKRVARPASLGASNPPAAPAKAPAEAVQELKQNLQSLNDLQARLRFMLKELEDLIK